MEDSISKELLGGLIKEEKRKKDGRIIIYYSRSDQSEGK